MHLYRLDWIIIAVSLSVCFLPALLFARRGKQNTTEFFASGRAVPWWLAGLSMVATTFSSDTPNLVTDIVRTQGVAGNWQWWSFLLTGMATVFFYARLWRRSRVLTDLEFYEIRYAGKAARVVRGFRAIYLGLFFNCMILATVNLAACKIANILFGLPRWQTLLGVGVLNVAFAAHSGLWGVLVIDMIQFFLKMSAVIAAAYFALKLPQIGGLHGLVTQLEHRPGPNGLNYLNILPDFSNQRETAVAVFVMPIAVLWWSVWYPGSEPGGGSYMAQRMLASKSERDALGSVLFFNLAHYVLRPWPWILVALASIIVYPQLSDIQSAFPQLDPSMLGHDIGYPAMLKFMPVGWFGLMIGGLIAANSSTVLTHLNWGASYLVHDFYQRFVHPGASEKHYVNAGRLFTAILFVLAAFTMLALDSAKSAFNVLMLVGGGTGLLYLTRWFWWRINAWCEIVAMIVSFAVSVIFLVMEKSGHNVPQDIRLITSITITTVCWILAAYLAPPTDEQTLIAFYNLVRPAGPGWKRIRRRIEQLQLATEATIDPATDSQRLTNLQTNFTPTTGSPDNLPLSMVGWVTGCTVVWSALFAIGNFLYGRTADAVVLIIVFALASTVLLYVVNRLWSDRSLSISASAAR